MSIGKFLPLVIGITCIGCAATSNNARREYMVREFPQGYICTNMSLPYAQAAYGVLSGQLSTDLLEEPGLIYLFRPADNECDPENPRILEFAEYADKNSDHLLTRNEVVEGLKKLKKELARSD